jgi:hypothetical protein
MLARTAEPGIHHVRREAGDGWQEPDCATASQASSKTNGADSDTSQASANGGHETRTANPETSGAGSC